MMALNNTELQRFLAEVEEINAELSAGDSGAELRARTFLAETIATGSKELLRTAFAAISDATSLLEACQYGQMCGYSANALLWNAAGIIRELANGRNNLLQMADDLRKKAKIEFKAVENARNHNM